MSQLLSQFTQQKRKFPTNNQNILIYTALSDDARFVRYLLDQCIHVASDEQILLISPFDEQIYSDFFSGIQNVKFLQICDLQQFKKHFAPQWKKFVRVLVFFDFSVVTVGQSLQQQIFLIQQVCQKAEHVFISCRSDFQFAFVKALNVINVRFMQKELCLRDLEDEGQKRQVYVDQEGFFNDV